MNIKKLMNWQAEELRKKIMEKYYPMRFIKSCFLSPAANIKLSSNIMDKAGTDGLFLINPLDSMNNNIKIFLN
jgi:hypothetical protein